MASAAITIGGVPATIESDTSEAVITKDQKLMTGTLVNAGTDTSFCKVALKGSASGVATTNAQAQYMFTLPKGASIPWLSHYASIAHKTASGTATLLWFPDKEYQR